jgi:hypothetical protein
MLMVSGLHRNGIAERLSQSPNTTRTHIRNVTLKLGCHSVLEAVAVALKVGLRPELGPPGAATPGGETSRAPSERRGGSGLGAPVAHGYNY